MRKHLNKILWAMIMVVTLSCVLTFGLMLTSVKKSSPIAHTQTEQIQADASKKIAQADPCSIIYVYYYREHNGWVQRRLWNRTQNKWAESTWKNVQRVTKK